MTKNENRRDASHAVLHLPASQIILLNCAILISLTGCAQHIKESASTPAADSNKIESETKIQSTAKLESKTKPETNAKDTEQSSLNTEDNSKLISNLSTKILRYKLDKLPYSTIICSVNGVPITMGDYRRQFKKEQQKIQASLTYNPELKNKLLHIAHAEGITLSAHERERLVKSVDKMQAGGTKSFNKMLSDGHITKRQFDDQVLDIGLACHAANVLVEKDLLKGLINVQLLSQAAKDNGYSKEAFNKYIEISKTPQYKKLLATGSFSTNELQDEIINDELCQKQAEKILSESPITDTDISDFYEQNRSKFKHGPLIRLSQIYLELPGKDPVSTSVINDNLKKEHPNLSTTEMNKGIADAQKKKYAVAQSLLERARKGEDFATLADQYSEGQKGTPKNGGDMGFQTESELAKDFSTKLAKLPIGGIVPEVIVNQYGYFIFKVTGKEGPGYYKFDEVKNHLKELLAEKKAPSVIDSWIAGQRKKASIVISPEMQKFLASNKLEKRETL